MPVAMKKVDVFDGIHDSRAVQKIDVVGGGKITKNATSPARSRPRSKRRKLAKGV